MVSLDKQLEQIAIDLVMIDLEDMPALANLHEAFLHLSEAVGGETDAAAKAARRCGDLVEKMVLNDVSDKESALSILNDAVAGLQALLRDNRDPSDVRFPSELGLGQSGAGGDAPPAEGRSAEDGTENAGGDENEQPQAPPMGSDTETESVAMSFEGADTSLLADFITEAREHCLTAEQMMMDLETGGDHEAMINAIFRSFHTIKGAAGFLDLNPVSMVAHESETLLDLARKGTLTIEGKTADTIFEAIDALRTLLDGIEEGLKTGATIDASPIISVVLDSLRDILSDPGAASDKETESRVGDILIDMGAVSQPQIDDTLARKEREEDRLGEALVKQGVVQAKSVAHALRVQKQMRKESDRVAVTAVKEMVRIDTERLDRLVDTIGELVIAESMVGQDEEFLATAPPKIARNVSYLNKITRELQEMGMAMRLVPVRPTFQKLARAVRDLTRKSGKKVDLITSGEDTEVDRTIVENIGDPLMHMIRNSVDHAIEMPEDRAKVGKPETGRVWLRAYHKGGSIHFDVEDDGCGLDKAKILAKAHESGLIDAQKEHSDKEIYHLILLPGFSTAAKVTDVSGRGVGMDVVRKNIDAMRGHLEIESTPQQGAKFTMRLPLTLAIIDGMMVRIEHERYIIPTISVVESLHLTPDMVHTVGGRRETISLRGRLLPLIKTAKLFGMPTKRKNDFEGVVVVVEDGERRVGLIADELLGQRQTVIKTLGPVFMKQKWVSGGAILSNGNVGLIIDVSGVIALADTLQHEMAEGNVHRRADVAMDKGEEEIEKVATPASN